MSRKEQNAELKTVNIIGGGIAGLATALAMQLNGIKYNLFEQNASITYDEVGLGISGNLFHILEEWKILEETKEIGTEISHFHFVDKQLKYLNSFKLQKPALSVKRRAFHELLYKHLDKNKIHLNSKKSPGDFSGEDMVISAEGIHSKTRQAIHPDLEIRDSNQILFRGISEIELGKKFRNAYHDFVGQNLRFAIIHTGKNYFSWYLIRQKNSNEIISPDKAILKSYFTGYASLIPQVIDKSENIYSSELLDINPKSRKNLKWFEKNTLLIGDAIHPTTPNMANGACLAMEDAYLLTGLLRNNHLSLLEIYAIFQKRRTQKVDPVVFQSWWFGKLSHQKNKTLNHIVKLGMGLTPQFLFDRIYSKVLVETRIEEEV